MSVIKLNQTFYRIGHDMTYISKETVYMCNKTAFISDQTFYEAYIEPARQELFFKEENETWTRSLTKAKDIVRKYWSAQNEKIKIVKWKNEDYWEVQE